MWGENMRKVHIIALHLAFGGIEKAICSMANIFAERCEVEIISVYDMPDAPAFPLDPRVKLRYLLKDRPNREEWKAALKSFNIPCLVKESFRSLKILRNKKVAVIKAIKSIDEGVIITTRHEDNVLLSKYGKSDVLKIAQLHHDHGFKRLYVRGFKKQYGRIDILAMLTPSLRDETIEIMRGENSHTKVVYVPNFLEHYPENVTVTAREKLVISVGRLNAVKRFDLLIKLFSDMHEQFPEWKLKIIGDGSDREKLTKLIEELNAEEYICLTGRKNSFEIENEMLNASVFALTSESEGFGFVLIEAQSCALPCIAYDVRVGPGFIINDGIDGYLIPEGDMTEFKNKLALIMSNEKLRCELGENALEASKHFTREKISKLWYSLIS